MSANITIDYAIHEEIHDLISVGDAAGLSGDQIETLVGAQFAEVTMVIPSVPKPLTMGTPLSGTINMDAVRDTARRTIDAVRENTAMGGMMTSIRQFETLGEVAPLGIWFRHPKPQDPIDLEVTLYGFPILSQKFPVEGKARAFVQELKAELVALLKDPSRHVCTDDSLRMSASDSARVFVFPTTTPLDLQSRIAYACNHRAEQEMYPYNF